MKSNQNIQPARVRRVLSVAAMAREVGMSRSRFYDYIALGVFPKPDYSPSTKRPYYTAEAQQAVIEARQTGIGCNGEYVVFYERTKPTGTAPTTKAAPVQSAVADLLARLAELGLSVTPEQVRQALDACFPGGTAGHDEAAVITTLNRYLRRPPGVR